MIEPYRRHSSDCKYSGKGQNYTKCSCPIWCYGRLPTGRPIRTTLKTRDWSRALRQIHQMESDPEGARPATTISEAVKSYLKDCEARKLAPSTIISYQNVLHPFQNFCESKAVIELEALTLKEFRSFRESRERSASTQRKEIEHLRGFCAFCIEHEWIKKNFAKSLKPPKEADPVTLPFEPDEVKALLKACDQIENANRESATRARLRNKALLLLLLYSGMRISDCIKLRRDRLRPDGKLFMRTMKTGHDLYLKLHSDCISALKALPLESKEYFFWSGNGKLSSAVGSARRSVECIKRLSGVSNTHPHRFRDTFAVELLYNGTDIRDVQHLLGHASIKTTEKYYAHFTPRFQQRLDEATEKLNFSL